MSHESPTEFGPVAFAAPHESTKKPAAKPSSPSPNLTGIEGFAFRAASQVQSQPNMGAKVTINMGFMSCSVLAGVCHCVPIFWNRTKSKIRTPTEAIKIIHFATGHKSSRLNTLYTTYK